MRRSTGAWAMTAAAVILLAAPAEGQQTAPTANVGGAWEVTFGPTMGGRVWTLELQGSGASFQGTLAMGPMGTAPVEEGSLTGDKVRFKTSFQAHGHGGTMVFEGTLAGDAIEGEMTGLPSGPVTFTAKRKEA